MVKHASIISKKFEIVDIIFKNYPLNLELDKPTGGYFVSFNSKPGKAKKIYNYVRLAGLKPKVGATFPYNNDPHDQNIRISPSKISNPELKKAMEVFIVSVMMAVNFSRLDVFHKTYH